jgi:NADPH2:quinone reductase
VRALRVVNEDGPDAVRLEEVPEPDGDLVVEVKAAGVSFPDLLMTRGEYQVRQPLPFTLGWEAAGDVVRAPSDSPFSPGDRVIALNFGAHAEQIAALPETTFALPGALSYEEGAALPLNYLTAVAALERRGRLVSGETVLVHGAAGGVGPATIQVAKALGATVIASVSTDAKAEIARTAGADQVVVGFTAGEIPEIRVNRLLLRNVDVCGCSFNVLADGPGGFAEPMQRLSELGDTGSRRPIVGSVHPLAEGPAALREIDERRATGKVVLAI